MERLTVRSHERPAPARRARGALERDTFTLAFEAICRGIRLKTTDGLALGVRIGPERDNVND